MSFVWSCTSGLARTAARRLLLVSIQPSEVTVRVSWNFDTANLLCCRETQITGSTALWVPRNCGRTKGVKEQRKAFTQQRQRAIWRLSQRHARKGKATKNGPESFAISVGQLKVCSINVIFGSFTQKCRGIQFLLKSDKNNWCFTWRLTYRSASFSLIHVYGATNISNRHRREKHYTWDKYHM